MRRRRLVGRYKLFAPRRRGIMLIMAIAVLAFSASVMASLVRTTLLSRDRMDRRDWKQQAELLAQAGLDRARHELRQSPDFQQADWTVPLMNSPGETGAARLRVLPGNGEHVRQVQVVALVPDGVRESIQVTLQTEVTLSP